MVIKQRPQLIGSHQSRRELAATAAAQLTKMHRLGQRRSEHPQGVLVGIEVGAQELGQLVAVPGVALRPRGTPARAQRVEGVGMHRHHRVSRSQQPIHDQAAAGLDRDGKIPRLLELGQPLHRGHQLVFTVPQRPMRHTMAALIGHRHVMGLSGPVPTCLHRRSPPTSGSSPGGRGSGRQLVVGPHRWWGKSLTPVPPSVPAGSATLTLAITWHAPQAVPCRAPRTQTRWVCHLRVPQRAPPAGRAAAKPAP